MPVLVAIARPDVLVPPLVVWRAYDQAASFSQAPAARRYRLNGYRALLVGCRYLSHVEHQAHGVRCRVRSCVTICQAGRSSRGLQPSCGTAPRLPLSAERAFSLALCLPPFSTQRSTFDQHPSMVRAQRLMLPQRPSMVRAQRLMLPQCPSIVRAQRLTLPQRPSMVRAQRAMLDRRVLMCSQGALMRACLSLAH